MWWHKDQRCPSCHLDVFSSGNLSSKRVTQLWIGLLLHAPCHSGAFAFSMLLLCLLLHSLPFSSFGFHFCFIWFLWLNKLLDHLVWVVRTYQQHLCLQVKLPNIDLNRVCFVGFAGEMSEIDRLHHLIISGCHLIERESLYKAACFCCSQNTRWNDSGG